MGLDQAEREALRSGAARFSEDLDDAAIDRFDRFVGELELWRARASLLASGERTNLVERHLVDSLASAPLLRSLAAHPRILDVGSGAGFPGVPLAIALHGAELTLLEPRRKRASFLRAGARVLEGVPLFVNEDKLAELAGRAGASAEVGGRADVDRAPGGFDAMVMRAALPIADLLSAAPILLRAGGTAIAYRGVAVGPTELEPSSEMGTPERIRYRLPKHSGDFSLLVWRRPA